MGEDSDYADESSDSSSDTKPSFREYKRKRRDDMRESNSGGKQLTTRRGKYEGGDAQSENEFSKKTIRSDYEKDFPTKSPSPRTSGRKMRKSSTRSSFKR